MRKFKPCSRKGSKLHEPLAGTSRSEQEHGAPNHERLATLQRADGDLGVRHDCSNFYITAAKGDGRISLLG